MAELNRIGSHLIWFGTFAMDLGATTAFLWAFAARERLYDLNEVVTGGGVFPQLFRPGGVRNDFPPAFFPMVENTLGELERSLAEYHGLISGNPIFLARTKGIGRLSAEDALAYGCSGPMLRGSGIPYDVRKADPYSVFIVSDGTEQPYRIKWRAPSFSNLQAVEFLAPGLTVADLVALVGSVDVVLGEVDR